MADLNDFFRTNLVDDHIAGDVNDLIAASLRSEYKNVETLSADRTLIDADTPIQRLDCNGANRVVKMPTGDAVDNHPFWIVNASDGGETLTVKNNAATVTLLVLAEGEAALFMPDGAGGYKVGSGRVQGDLYNYLINGGFDFARRLIAPGTLTTVADKSWGADRWQQFAENASWQYNRNDATGESGLTSQYYGLFKKITNTGKGIFVQKIESVNSIPLRGKTVIFQIKMKASSSKTIRMGILELQTAGTVDTFPAALASAFGANTTDPTWGTNVAVITGAESKSVTTSWQSFSVSVTVPSNSKNAVCAIWTDSQFAANDTLSVAEAGLFVASTVQAWKPRLPKEEYDLCTWYCEVFDGVDSSDGTTELAFGLMVSTSKVDTKLNYAPKRVAPTISTPDATKWAVGSAAAFTAGITMSFASQNRTTAYLGLTCSASHTTGQAGRVLSNGAGHQLVVNAEIA